ncbi:MAG: hypothetical protein U1D26_02525 [Patescibacteria group bacterium]|nr:hypothetical protein [bacterium]MDZ4227332.1 hypothetical protein [Patescibacteria group bacterium]
MTTPKLENGGHVVFVCVLNVDRSPLAEAMFRAKMKGLGWDCHIESAGILAIEGQPAAPEWRTHHFARNFDLSDHLSRGVSVVAYTDKTFFVCVDQIVHAFASGLEGVSEERVLLLHPRGVPSPREASYDTIFTLIHAGIAMLCHELDAY